jgi:hypothetical protein
LRSRTRGDMILLEREGALALDSECQGNHVPQHFPHVRSMLDQGARRVRREDVVDSSRKLRTASRVLSRHG